MCKFFSGLIDEKGKTYWKNGVSSHSKLEELFNISSSDMEHEKYAKWELHPSGNMNDVENWKFLIDENPKPKWWNNGYELFCKDTVKEWLKIKKWDNDLDLQGTPITSLPKGLTVGGCLYLRGTPITSLPKGLTVGGGLYLRGTPITSLPKGLTVGGDLYLRGTQITSLPKGLTVGGDLDLRGTQITSLPKGLTVGGGLYLRGTQITSIPKYLKNKVIRR